MWLLKNKKSLIWVKFFASKLVNDFYTFDTCIKKRLACKIINSVV